MWRLIYDFVKKIINMFIWNFWNSMYFFARSRKPTYHEMSIYRVWNNPFGHCRSFLSSWRGVWSVVGTSTTDKDGRSWPLMDLVEDLKPGTYRISFNTGKWGFLPYVSIAFEVTESQKREHFHVPLLLSPFFSQHTVEARTVVQSSIHLVFGCTVIGHLSGLLCNIKQVNFSCVSFLQKMANSYANEIILLQALGLSPVLTSPSPSSETCLQKKHTYKK